MPKVLEIIIKGICWMFVFWDTDVYENRAHVHVGKKTGKGASFRLAKIWLEPEIKVAEQGDLTNAQLNEILEYTKQNKEALLTQWKTFKDGDKITIIKIRKK